MILSESGTHLIHASASQVLQEAALRHQFEDCVSPFLIISFPVITGKAEIFFPNMWNLGMRMTENLDHSRFPLHGHFLRERVLQTHELLLFIYKGLVYRLRNFLFPIILYSGVHKNTDYST